MRKPRAFVDMDGVIVNFDGYLQMRRDAAAIGRQEFGGAEQIKHEEGAYAEMMPSPGGLEGVRSLIGMGFDVWIATKPPTGMAHAYRDKAKWIFTWLPELRRKLIITHHKGLLGDDNDVLIDDRPHKAFCHEFQGTLIFHSDWTQTLDRCRRRMAGEHVLADMARRSYLRRAAEYRYYQRDDHRSVLYMQLEMLRTSYLNAGGHEKELPTVQSPAATFDGDPQR